MTHFAQGPATPLPGASPSEPGTPRTEALRAKAESTSISEVMSRSIVCLAPEARVDAVTQMFLERGISSAPIVDAAWQPVGMVSKTDLLRAIILDREARSAPAEASEAQGTSSASRAADVDTDTEPTAAATPINGASAVGDIAVPYVLSLHEEAPVSVAAALMAYEGVHCLPIVASSGEVVGVVSTLDIIKWVARATDLEVGAESP